MSVEAAPPRTDRQHQMDKMAMAKDLQRQVQEICKSDLNGYLLITTEQEEGVPGAVSGTTVASCQSCMYGLINTLATLRVITQEYEDDLKRQCYSAAERKGMDAEKYYKGALKEVAENQERAEVSRKKFNDAGESE